MSQYNILVVDDDREIVRSLGKLLELEGYRVKKAYNGMEALDILMTEQIHLILLDVMMPKMNGLSALMKIREKNNIPIIMLSAKTEESDKVRRTHGTCQIPAPPLLFLRRRKRNHARPGYPEKRRSAAEPKHQRTPGGR